MVQLYSYALAKESLAIMNARDTNDFDFDSFKDMVDFLKGKDKFVITGETKWGEKIVKRGSSQTEALKPKAKEEGKVPETKASEEKQAPKSKSEDSDSIFTSADSALARKMLIEKYGNKGSTKEDAPRYLKDNRGNPVSKERNEAYQKAAKAKATKSTKAKRKNEERLTYLSNEDMERMIEQGEVDKAYEMQVKVVEDTLKKLFFRTNDTGGAFAGSAEVVFEVAKLGYLYAKKKSLNLTVRRGTRKSLTDLVRA